MARKPRTAKRTAKQIQASQRWASAGRTAQAAKRKQYEATHHGQKPPRTKAETAATKRWQAAGAQATHAKAMAKAQGKPPAPAKVPKAAVDLAARDRLDGGTPLGSPDYLHSLPVCGATAIAEHLYAATGIAVPDQAVIALAESATGATLGDLLEHVTAEGLGGWRLIFFRRCDPQLLVPGLIAGLTLSAGYHAVLAHPGGMLTWGMLLPWTAPPEEAWYLEWGAPG